MMLLEEWFLRAEAGHTYPDIGFGAEGPTPEPIPYLANVTTAHNLPWPGPNCFDARWLNERMEGFIRLKPQGPGNGQPTQDMSWPVQFRQAIPNQPTFMR